MAINIDDVWHVHCSRAPKVSKRKKSRRRRRVHQVSFVDDDMFDRSVYKHIRPDVTSDFQPSSQPLSDIIKFRHFDDEIICQSHQLGAGQRCEQIIFQVVW